ncbi:MAG TPA: hypothetical protein PK668_07770 [Myxococcota bacterium]|nr:hypothetical protein [Myxococcota bacterium]HRY93129.1 hypothetical protein [Myxococcota bacterium]
MIPNQLDQRIVTLSRDLVARLDRQRRLCAAFRKDACAQLNALELAAVGVRDALLDALERGPRRPEAHAAMLAADLRLELLAAEAVGAAGLEPIACEEIARSVRELRGAIGACVSIGVNQRS